MPEMSTLLDELRMLDYETCYQYEFGPLGEYSEFDDYGEIKNDIDIYKLNDNGKEAWLQWCLQKAIEARPGWRFAIGPRRVP